MCPGIDQNCVALVVSQSWDWLNSWVRSRLKQELQQLPIGMTLTIRRDGVHFIRKVRFYGAVSGGRTHTYTRLCGKKKVAYV